VCCYSKNTANSGKCKQRYPIQNPNEHRSLEHNFTTVLLVDSQRGAQKKAQAFGSQRLKKRVAAQINKASQEKKSHEICRPIDN
jgi:hypothetical protein